MIQVVRRRRLHKGSRGAVSRVLVVLGVWLGTACTPLHPGSSSTAAIGDVQLLAAEQWQDRHQHLLAATGLLDALGGLLAEGTITGYDIRSRGVLADFHARPAVIYSHSSLRHVRQLVELLDAHGVQGNLQVAPKISGYLYRDGWGAAPGDLDALPDGRKLVQAREIATLFMFDDAGQRLRFHELVSRHAKRDRDDQPGLLDDSWWQPFYYTGSPMQGFKRINLVVVSTRRHEATLTVLEDNAQAVVDALDGAPWPLRVEQVWVNPAFFRFLQGGYK